MRSRGGHADATHRAIRQRQAPAREGRESESRVVPATPQCTEGPGQSSPWGDEERFAHAMRQLRVYIRMLSALLVAAVARAVIDGFTLGLTLALALTGVLLVAALRRLAARGPAVRGPNAAGPPLMPLVIERSGCQGQRQRSGLADQADNP